MAKVGKESILKGIKGKVGKDLLVREVNGETILTLHNASGNRKSSPGRKVTRDKFAEATRFAKMALCNQEKKAYYEQLAEKLGLTNAYTAAVKEFMCDGDINRSPKTKKTVSKRQHSTSSSPHIPSLAIQRAGDSTTKVNMEVSLEGTPDIVKDFSLEVIVKDKNGNIVSKSFNMISEFLKLK